MESVYSMQTVEPAEEAQTGCGKPGWSVSTYLQLKFKLQMLHLKRAMLFAELSVLSRVGCLLIFQHLLKR